LACLASWRLPCFFAVLLSAADVSADTGDLALGAEVGATWPMGARAAVVGQIGLTDWLAARLELGGELLEERAAARGGGFIVGALDVIDWVPELALGAVGVAGEGARGALRLGVRRWTSASSSVAVALSGELGTEAWAGGLCLSLWVHP
jgi:hypothetical protein